jgi:DNA-binding MarR family transcriptional regulator
LEETMDPGSETDGKRRAGSTQRGQKSYSPGGGLGPRHSFDIPAEGEIPSGRYDLQVLQALRRIMRATDLYSKRLAAEHQLTVPQLLCLLSIHEGEPLTATSIARRVHLSASTVVGILDRLGAKDLVVRRRDSADRRIVNVTLSERGMTVASGAPSPLQERFVRAFEKLPGTEQEMIASALQRIVDLMEAKDLDAAPMLAAEQSLHGEQEESRG